MPTSKPATNRYERGARELLLSVRKSILDHLRPPKYLSLSQWSEEYAYISAETSADAGKFHAFEYQNGIMDAVTDPKVTTITVMKSARVGYTKILDNVIGYFVHQEPCPIMVVQPDEQAAETYSRKNIAPMLRDTPVLAKIQGEVKDKDPDQRISERSFKNKASITFVGAHAPGGFRAATIRVLCFDEVDGYKVTGAGAEGDQIALGRKRTETYWNRKIILGSTPTLKSTSRIEKSFQESDQRYFHVPCPHCGEKQVLKWENLHWDKETGENGKTIHKPETAYFVCEHSGCIIEEHHKPAMIDGGEWIAEKPFKGHAGFFIWTAYSLHINASWANIATEFLAAKDDPTQLRTFVNTTLGQTWEEQGETLESGNLLSRVENFDADTIPDGVKVLTAGVDVQDNRLELLVVGWGAKEESWVVSHETILGDPAQPTIWNDLDQLLLEKFYTSDDRVLRIRTAAVDTGGHHTERVYAFCKDRHKRGVYSIKGVGGARPVWPKRASKGGAKGNDIFYPVGVDSAKDAIYARLRIAVPGPGYVHFAACDCDEDFFKQLTAERVVTRYKAGRPYRVWVLPGGKRNEVLDLFVYAFAALRSTTLRLDRLESPVVVTQPEEGEPAPVAIVPEELKQVVNEIVSRPSTSPGPGPAPGPAPARQPVSRKQNPYTKGKGWF